MGIDRYIHRVRAKVFGAMTASTRQFLAFITFTLGWSFLASLAMGAHIHPVAVFVVWIVGFVWGVAYIIGGQADADLLLKRWLQLMGATVLAGAMIAAFLS